MHSGRGYLGQYQVAGFVAQPLERCAMVVHGNHRETFAHQRKSGHVQVIMVAFDHKDDWANSRQLSSLLLHL